MKQKMLEFDRYEAIATGDVYYCYGVPEEKDIDGVKFINVTPDFHRTVFIRKEALKKNGKEKHVIYD